MSPRYSIATARHMAGNMASILSLTRGAQEKALTLVFVLRYAVWRYLRRRGKRDWATLRLRGVDYQIRLGSGEVSVIPEIYIDRVYDRLADFVPVPGWTVLDVGANAGFFAAQQAQRGAVVYAFEPNPDCFERLTLLSGQAPISPRLNLFNVAVGSSRGSAWLVGDPGRTTTASVSRATVAFDSPSAVAVELVTLDECAELAELGSVDLLKIDVEGAENEVIAGANQILGRVARIVVEYHSSELLEQLTNTLSGHGFALALDVNDPWPNAKTLGVGVAYYRRPSTSSVSAPTGC